MSCIINAATRKTAHVEPSSRLRLYYETTCKTRRENFLREVILVSARYIGKKERESEGKQANASRYDAPRCSSIVFPAIDSGASLIINAPTGEAWNTPGVTNSRTTPPRPVAFFVDIISLLPADCGHFRLPPRSPSMFQKFDVLKRRYIIYNGVFREAIIEESHLNLSK